MSVNFELNLYRLYLATGWTQAAALLSEHVSKGDKEVILKRMREEWSVVLELEQTESGQQALRGSCSQVLHQAYREVMSSLECSNWVVNDASREIIRAWVPELSCSSNVEQLFASMSDAVKRASKPDEATAPALMAVGIRALERRLFAEDTSATKVVKLEDADWQSKQVRALKPKIWSPSSMQACPLAKSLSQRFRADMSLQKKQRPVGSGS